MVRYAIVRYTKEIVGYADGEKEAKTTAYILSKHDYDDLDCNEVWYDIEPDHVY